MTDAKTTQGQMSSLHWLDIANADAKDCIQCKEPFHVQHLTSFETRYFVDDDGDIIAEHNEGRGYYVYYQMASGYRMESDGVIRPIL